ncbi:cupin domain-containing protein [Candidatus Halocynthiibacter alkanivorans]|uniref:cupin domain-containing protein n=1 Tax=Candidatus Halocynthiibacter alkanivorans TaxID=2267619 RepID=UPI000DF1AED2|nr:cupin domain-containing protein [Candidatus Halocynthiibacter alkanivorans]
MSARVCLKAPFVRGSPRDVFYHQGYGNLYLGDETYDGVKGDLIHIPPNVPHQVIAGSEGVHMLMIFSPGTTEAMFAERNDWRTGASVARKHKTIWLENFPKAPAD